MRSETLLANSIKKNVSHEAHTGPVSDLYSIEQ